jgi:uncharacterized protein YdiU (UPF0061 family)
LRIDFDNTFVDLPQEFHAQAEPSAAVKPTLIAFNEGLAQELGIERGDTTDEELADLFSGARIFEGAHPIATVYAGHQFGNPVPRLGDGRAILLGEVVGRDGLRRDIQLKGAGRTAYSRGGDGKSPLGPVLREYLVSEAMHALGIPATRALAAVTTGDHVFRDRPLPGAVLTRVAASHLRVGTFEYFARQEADDGLRVLLEYAIRRHDPDLEGGDDRAFEFFLRVAHRFLDLVARWWGLGFIHGVMNTDNTSISGETIDFGPCAFMDAFRFDKVFSSIDRGGRYRFENQAPVAVWNLSILASCLVPLVDEKEERAVERLQEALSHFDSWFRARWLAVMTAKLGIAQPEPSDRDLVEAYLNRLQDQELDYTNAFRALSSEFDVASPFHERWRTRLTGEGRPREEVVARMNNANPVVVPRNHQIETAIVDAREGDFAHFHALASALKSPFEDSPELAPFKAPPTPEQEVHNTFCGT